VIEIQGRTWNMKLGFLLMGRFLLVLGFSSHVSMSNEKLAIG
jgi:hypothetical protein